MTSDDLTLWMTLTGAESDIADVRTYLNGTSVLDSHVIPSTPLHMGDETISLVVSVAGAAGSLIGLVLYLFDRRRTMDIEIKTGDDETIRLSKDAPWTERDFQSLLRFLAKK